MEIKEIKIIRIVILALIFLGFILFHFFQEKKSKENRQHFSEEVYHGIVEDIKYAKTKRGYPDYLINGQWVYFGGFFEHSEEYVNIGDSLAKEKGTKIVEVYSKNKKGKWELEYPNQRINIDSLLK